MSTSLAVLLFSSSLCPLLRCHSTVRMHSARISVNSWALRAAMEAEVAIPPDDDAEPPDGLNEELR
jgi:hypothetical protein